MQNFYSTVYVSADTDIVFQLHTETDTDIHADAGTQQEFDEFSAVTLGLLNHFYPERSNTVTSRGPRHLTAAI